MMVKTGEIKSEHLNGIYSELANLLGIDAVRKIHASYRGQQISFPVELYGKEYIAGQIAAAYDGNNVKQLATRFGYSEKWIRKILKDQAEKGQT